LSFLFLTTGSGVGAREHISQNGPKAVVVAKRVEPGFDRQPYAVCRPVLDRFLQPVQSQFLIAKSQMDESEMIGGNVFSLRATAQLFQYFYGFLPLTRPAEEMSKA
jgi:hypothetical protein